MKPLKPIHIVSLPSDEKSNDYFKLLYSGLGQKPLTRLVLAHNVWRTLWGMIDNRHYMVLHIHWFHCTHCLRHIFKLLFWLSVQVIFAKRFALFFTPHNVMRHNQTQINIVEYYLRRRLLKQANSVIVHCQREIKLLRRYFRLKTTHNFIVISHPLYSFNQPTSAQQINAFWNKYHIPQQYLLSFGQIAPYKQIEQLLSAWQAVPNKNGFILLIAGKFRADNQAYCQALQQQAAAIEQVQLLDLFVPTEILSQLVQQAHACVFSYRRITTSGAVFFALSLQRWVIVPRKGCLAALPSEGILHYRGEQALIDCLSKVLQIDRPPPVNPVHKQATVENVQQQLYQAYQACFTD
jgi:glycosyltransferase involved in cell wall biosynthesis